MEWIVMVVRLPTEPSRHRVAVWRELRRAGGVQLGPGSWALPALTVFTASVDRIQALVDRGGGEVITLEAQGRDEVSAARMEVTYTEAREAEWTEFISECGKYLAELAREVASEKYTVAELDEEEQSMERLRRWYRELGARDAFGAHSAPAAASRLQDCADSLEDYTDRVFRTLNPDPPSGS